MRARRLCLRLIGAGQRRGSLGWVKLLFVGDVVGSPGRKGLREAMPRLLEQHAPDLSIVNGENSAGGLGITDRTGRDLFEMGFDVITLGNHTYRRKEAYTYLDEEERVIRPANFMTYAPGKGHVIVEAGGMRVVRDQPDRHAPAPGRALARSPRPTRS